MILKYLKYKNAKKKMSILKNNNISLFLATFLFTINNIA